MSNSSEGLGGARGNYPSPINLWCCSQKDMLITIAAIAAIGAVIVGILTLLTSAYPDFLSGLNSLGTPGGASFIAIGIVGLVSVFLCACYCKDKESPLQSAIKHSAILTEEKPKVAKKNDVILQSVDNQQENAKTITTEKKSSMEAQLRGTPVNTFPDSIPSIGQELDKQQILKDVPEFTGHPTSKVEDDKKIGQNQIKIEQTRQAFQNSLERNYQECHSQLQKVSDFLQAEMGNYSIENLPTTYDELVALHQKIFKNTAILLRLEGDLDFYFKSFLNSEATFATHWYGISVYSDIEKQDIFKDKNNEKYVLFEKQVNEKLQQTKELLGTLKELYKITDDLIKVASQQQAHEMTLTWMLSLHDQMLGPLQGKYSAFTQSMSRLTNYLETNVRQGAFDQSQLHTLLIHAERTAFDVFYPWIELMYFRRAVSKVDSSVQILPTPCEANIQKDLQEFQSIREEAIKHLDVDHLQGLLGYSSVKFSMLI